MIIAPDNCARWLHVVNLHKPRIVWPYANSQTFKIRSKWVWPLHYEGKVVGGDDSEGESSDEGAEVRLEGSEASVGDGSGEVSSEGPELQRLRM